MLFYSSLVPPIFLYIKSLKGPINSLKNGEFKCKLPLNIVKKICHLGGYKKVFKIFPAKILCTPKNCIWKFFGKIILPEVNIRQQTDSLGITFLLSSNDIMFYSSKIVLRVVLRILYQASCVTNF